MSDRKKLMPTITNYLSNSDEDIDGIVDTNTNIDAPQLQINYAEWKRLQKESPNLTNGKQIISKYIQTPLGDISSCEEDSKYDDSDPIYKIINCLADKEEFRKRNDCIRRKHKKQSHFLLFARMKQHKHYDCSFSDLCQIIQASWDNLQPSENEELMGNIDYRLREYKEALTKFKISLMPDNFTSRPKCNLWVSAAAAKKQEVDEVVTTTITDNRAPITHSKIPERLQSLAGNANVYNAPDKSTRISRHSLKSYETANMYNSDTGLDYVTAIKSNINCNFPDCENKSVEDIRWDGQYCSAKCLIKDCNLKLKSWLTNRNGKLTNGDNNNEASPSSIHDSDESIARDENLFESLQNKQNSYCNSDSEFSPDSQRRNVQSVQTLDSDNDIESEGKVEFFQNNSTTLELSSQIEECESFYNQTKMLGTKTSL